MNKEKKQAIQSLKTAKGQIEGVIKMIEDDRDCMDISNQIVAIGSLVKKAQTLMLKQHITHCVTAAIESENGEEKLAEIAKILEKITK